MCKNFVLMLNNTHSEHFMQIKIAGIMFVVAIAEPKDDTTD